MILIDKSQFDVDRIKKIYKEYIVPEVKTKIEGEIKKASEPNLTESHKIAISFLQEYFVDKKGEVSSDRITLYLFDETLTDPQAYLESVILTYWRCVLHAWHTQKKIAMPTDAEIKALSKWKAVKEYAKNQCHQEERIRLVTSTITDGTYHLFTDVTKADVFSWSISSAEISDEKLDKIDFLPELRNDLFSDKKKDDASTAKTNNDSALDILEGIFVYDRLNRSLAKGSPRHQLLSAMNVTVCPYCNRQYISLYTDSKSQKTTADLDHFYIKSQYPYLALSLHNFIPSCQICNSRFKGTTDFYIKPHIYPHTQGFGEKARFRIKLDSNLLDDSATWKDIKMIELVDESKSEAITNSMNTFLLEEIYQSHVDYVQEIWAKSRRYNSDMIDTLDKEFSKLFDSERSVVDLIFSQYLEYEKLCKRPLSKLTRDILSECYEDQIIKKYIL